MNARYLVALFGMTVAVAACGKGSSDSGSSSTPTPVADTKQAKPSTDTKPATPVAVAKPDTAVAVAKPAGDFGSDGLPNDIPTARSPVPTMAEWTAVPREITVARSTPLGCTTKMVREWLQISCHGKDSKGGDAATVETKAGGGGDTYLFAKDKVTSLVTPVLRNHHYEATFGWTDQKQVLVVDWANGAPRPTIKFADP